MSTFTQFAFYLPMQQHSLAATCFMPTKVVGSVLLLLPLGEERKGTLPLYVQCGRAWAARGWLVLLFDFSGTGDSSGDFDSVDPCQYQVEAEAALHWLLRSAPDLPCYVLATRISGVIAAQLAAEHPDISGVVWWAPLSGRVFLQQLTQRRMVNNMIAYGRAREGRDFIENALQEYGKADFDGYLLTARLYAWLEGVSIHSVQQPAICFAAGHSDSNSVALLKGGAAEISELRFPPFWNTVGHLKLESLIEQTTEWLSAQIGEQPPVALPLPVMVTQTPGARVESLATQHGELQLVWDMPEQKPVAGCLFLHGWSGDRTGPHRLFTRFGRELAQQGTLSLRMDFTGRGLSDGSAAESSIQIMRDNAESALCLLQERLPPDTPLIVVAICSGCKVALALSATHHAQIERLLLWSAESMGFLRDKSTDWRKGWHMLAMYGRKLFQRATWEKILRGKVQGKMVGKALLAQEKRSEAEALWEDQILQQLSGCSTSFLFVFGGSDPDAPGSSQAYQCYCKKHNIPFEMHTIEHAGHSYYGEEWTSELLRISHEFIAKPACSIQ